MDKRDVARSSEIFDIGTIANQFMDVPPKVLAINGTSDRVRHVAANLSCG